MDFQADTLGYQLWEGHLGEVIIIKTEGLLSLDEALADLDIGYATIYRWIRKGLLTPVKINGQNFFPTSEIERIKRARLGQVNPA